ncbi:MAG: hypothetical protein ACFFB8_14890 [Promethearchaeota archaeon]
MPQKYHCPQCKSENIIEYEDFLECTQCGLTFFKETLDRNIDDEDVLAEEDLHEFVDTFNELKDEKTRKRFFKSLKKDLDL